MIKLNFQGAIIIITGMLLVFIYDFQIQELNAYRGMRPINYNISYFYITFIFLAIMFLLAPREINIPSGIFVTIYTLFVMLPAVFLHSVSNILEEGVVILLFFNYVSLVFIYMLILPIRATLTKFDFSSISLKKDSSFLGWMFSFFIFVSFYIIYKKLGIDLSIDLAHERRMNGRELLSGISAYILSISLNGVAPYLAFMGFSQKKYYLFFVALFFVISGYGFIGTKAPVVFVFFLALVGFFYSGRRFSIPGLFIYSSLILCIFSVIEFLIFDSYYLSDYIVRRVFSVVPQTQAYYIDYFLNHAPLSDLVLGRSGDETGIAYLIGERYSNDPLENNNTNAFLFEMGRNGVFGYFLSLVIVAVFFAFMDVLFIKYKLTESIGLAVIYSLIIIEQSYSVALVSSGVLFVAMSIIIVAIKRPFY